MDTSEETSDTCVDEHHDISSGPPSGPMEYFAATAGRTPTASRRSRSNHSPSKSPHSWSRRPGDKNLERATRYVLLFHSVESSFSFFVSSFRSRDSGINDQRESLSLSCSCNNDTSCGSCSDQSDDHHHQHVHGHVHQHMNRSHPNRQSTTSSQFRRHKSASPSR